MALWPKVGRLDTTFSYVFYLLSLSFYLLSQFLYTFSIFLTQFLSFAHRFIIIDKCIEGERLIKIKKIMS